MTGKVAMKDSMIFVEGPEFGIDVFPSVGSFFRNSDTKKQLPLQTGIASNRLIQMF